MTDALDGATIEACLGGDAARRLRYLTVLSSVDSTNAELQRQPPERQHAHAILAGHQSSGRGRRQRSWHSPVGNVYLSLGWRFERQPVALPLAVAVCVCRALDGTGLRGHGIKWPNDILVDGAKLAGVLVELTSGGSGGSQAVIGVGVNVDLPDSPESRSAIDQAWTDLASHLPGGAVIDRNRLAGCLLDELLPGLERFGRDGFAAFRQAWSRRDLLSGRAVRVQTDGPEIAGIAIGVDAGGSLLVDTAEQGVMVIHAGDVSVRHD